MEDFLQPPREHHEKEMRGFDHHGICLSTRLDAVEE